MEDSTGGTAIDPQSELLKQWIAFAPKPPPRGQRKYDVFISYRSSDRAWAMALYDALKLAGWDAFLDQFDLVPGAGLTSSLQAALLASSSGVILWSSRTKDSVWCERERTAMCTLKDRQAGGGFNYIFAKLDNEEMPLFALNDLYVDFQDSPEGPRGANLLRLISGMRGVPLAREAVVMAQEVDEAVRKSMQQIGGAIEAGNASRLLAIGTSTQPGVLVSPGPVLAAAQGLIRVGEYDSALTVLNHALALFPKSIRARQLEGLALRRLRRFQEAVDILSELKAAGHQDPETLGILAASWDGLFQSSKRTLHLRSARELYRTAFTNDPRDYYTGINAASKSLILGEAAESLRIAGLVLPLVEHAADGEDLYAASTLGEVYLLQRKLDEAAAQYQRVIDRHPTSVGNLKGTGEQAERICSALELTRDEMAKVLAPFQLLA